MSVYGFEIRATGNAIEQMKSIELEMDKMAGQADITTANIGTAFTELGDKVSLAFEKIRTVAEATFGAIALFKGFEFIEESGEYFEKLKQANAQLVSGLESTRYASGETMKSLKKDQDDYSEKVEYSKAQLADMQAQLLTFPSINKKVFGLTEQSIEDMATRLHKDLDSVAIMVGKAMQDPGQGATMLRRVGVNFTKDQIGYMKQLVAEGDKYKAQLYILNELQTEFGGSAQSAFNANPEEQFDKSIEKLQQDLGGVIDKLKKEVAPVLSNIADGFKNTIDWMKQHKDMLITIWNALKPLLELWIAYKAAMLLETAATWAAVAAQWALNAAMDANPIGIMITAVGALALAYGNLSGNIDLATQAKSGFDQPSYKIAQDAIDKLRDSYTDKKGKLDSKGFEETLEYQIAKTKKQISDYNAKMTEQLAPKYANSNTLYGQMIKSGKIKGESKDAAGAQGTVYGLSILNANLKALNDALKQNKLQYGGPGGTNAITGSAFKTSELTGAKGGLGEAKVINIKIDTVQKNIGVKESKDKASDAAQIILKEVQNLYYSQSANF